MNNDNELEDYEVGYGRPPKSGQFKKGISGDPSGRPKKSSDFASELQKELQSKVTINENGQKKVIKKSEGVAKQVVNKALSGNLPAVRLVMSVDRETQERVAEQQQNSLNGPEIDPKPEDMTDEELLMIAQGIHPKYSITKCPNCSHSLDRLSGWDFPTTQERNSR
jgi:hypothetical protein